MPPGIETITLRRPDDWHVHLRDGGMLTTVVQYTARQFARAIVMPNLLPPVTSVPAARAYRLRILRALSRAGSRVHAADDLLSDRHDRAGRGRRWLSGRSVHRGQAVPCAGDDQFGFWRDRLRARRAGARMHGEARHAVVASWRGDRSGGRRVRPRGSVHRPGARPIAATLARIAPRARAHHDRRGSGLRNLGRAKPGGDDHRASSCDQSQRDLCRRDPSAPLLPADRQAREASVGFAPGGNVG